MVAITKDELNLFDMYIFSKDKEERENIMKKWIKENDPLSSLDQAINRFYLALESFRLSYDI